MGQLRVASVTHAVECVCVYVCMFIIRIHRLNHTVCVLGYMSLYETYPYVLYKRLTRGFRVRLT